MFKNPLFKSQGIGQKRLEEQEEARKRRVTDKKKTKFWKKLKDVY